MTVDLRLLTAVVLPRPVTVFVGVLLVAALATWALPLVRWIDGYWLWAVGIAAVAAWFARARASGGGGAGTWLSRGEFLCDSCKYDHPDLCDRRERPNATSCPDYRQRG